MLSALRVPTRQTTSSSYNYLSTQPLFGFQSKLISGKIYPRRVFELSLSKSLETGTLWPCSVGLFRVLKEIDDLRNASKKTRDSIAEPDWNNERTISLLGQDWYNQWIGLRTCELRRTFQSHCFGHDAAWQEATDAQKIGLLYIATMTST
jgi:hypothetical protein